MSVAPVGFAPAPEEAAEPPSPHASWREHLAHRWRRWWFVAVALVLTVLLSVLALVLGSRTTDRPLAPDNPGDRGARAAAQILGDQGVSVDSATTLAEVGALAGPGTTVLVTDLSRLDAQQRTDLMATGADVVLVGATFTGLDDLPGVSDRVEPTGAGSPDPVPARCDAPAARAAGEISGTVGGVTALDDAVTVCFPVGEDAGAYASWQHGQQHLQYLADPALLTNERLADHGNAALVLHALGGNDTLVWYLPAPTDTSGTDDAVPMVPPQLFWVLVQLLVVGAVVALWRGRALGPVVTEVMPVAVRSAETTRGRGRLYRRSGDHAHAAAALRAGTARRSARRLGLPRSAGPDQLLAALARATGRDGTELGSLLYGPPPTDDAGLLTLSTALDTLESEVHRS